MISWRVILLFTLKDDKILFRVKNALKMCTICYIRFSWKKEKKCKTKNTTHLWNFTVVFSVKWINFIGFFGLEKTYKTQIHSFLLFTQFMVLFSFISSFQLRNWNNCFNLSWIILRKVFDGDTKTVLPVRYNHFVKQENAGYFRSITQQIVRQRNNCCFI